jgi:hypothetical protein
MLYSNATVFRFVRYVISYSLSDLSALYLAAEFRKDKTGARPCSGSWAKWAAPWITMTRLPGWG